MTFLAQQILTLSLKDDPGGTRTHNPQLRRLMPYPLGHWALSLVKLEVFTQPDAK